MLKLAIACVAAALFGTADALYNKGKCPDITSIPYRSEIATPTWQRFSYTDQMTYGYFM